MVRKIQAGRWIGYRAPFIIGMFLCVACSRGAATIGGAETATPPAPTAAPSAISSSSPSAPAASAPAPTVAPAGSGYARTIMIADDGRTVSVKVGERIALSLSQPSGLYRFPMKSSR